MDFKQLKELAKKLGGILVMDGNSPDFVLLSYQKYIELQQQVSQNTTPPSTNRQTDVSEDLLIERLNKEIASLKEEIRQKEESEMTGVSSVESQENGEQNTAEEFLEAIRQEMSE